MGSWGNLWPQGPHFPHFLLSGYNNKTSDRKTCMKNNQQIKPLRTDWSTEIRLMCMLAWHSWVWKKSASAFPGTITATLATCTNMSGSFQALFKSNDVRWWKRSVSEVPSKPRLNPSHSWHWCILETCLCCSQGSKEELLEEWLKSDLMMVNTVAPLFPQHPMLSLLSLLRKTFRILTGKENSNSKPQLEQHWTHLHAGHPVQWHAKANFF